MQNKGDLIHARMQAPLQYPSTSLSFSAHLSCYPFWLDTLLNSLSLIRSLGEEGPNYCRIAQRSEANSRVCSP